MPYRTAPWDYLIVTAANAPQAAAYQSQIQLRRERGQLAQVRDVLVIPDRDGRRVGSGGSTLQCLAEEIRADWLAEMVEARQRAEGIETHRQAHGVEFTGKTPAPEERPPGVPQPLANQSLQSRRRSWTQHRNAPEPTSTRLAGKSPATGRGVPRFPGSSAPTRPTTAAAVARPLARMK